MRHVGRLVVGWHFGLALLLRCKNRLAESIGFFPCSARLGHSWLSAVVVALSFVSLASAMDQVTFRHDGKTIDVTGKVLITARDGGLLLMGRDGMFWTIMPDEQVSHTSNAASFKPFTRDELSKRLLADLPKGFKVHSTTHYLICYDTSLSYAQWCGALFERLYTVFTNALSRKGFELHEPSFPLVAVVFADKDAYKEFSKSELGDVGESVTGYFHILSESHDHV